jgi:hypothetical protein
MDHEHNRQHSRPSRWALDGVRAAGSAVTRWWVSYTAWRIELLAARLREEGGPHEGAPQRL